MATIVLGDDQRMRAARQQAPIHYAQRQSVMQGGDKLTPNDVVQMAMYAYGGANAIAPMLGGGPKGLPTGNGPLPPPAGPSNAFGLGAPPQPPQSMTQQVAASLLGGQQQPGLGMSLGAPQQQMGAPSLGLQPMPQSQFATPFQMMPDLGAYPGMQAQQSPVDMYRETLDFQFPAQNPTPQMFVPPAQDVAFPAMRDIPPSQMMPGGPAAAQAPMAPPPMAQQAPQQQALQQAPQQGGGDILRLPVAVAPPSYVPPVRPNAQMVQIGGDIAAAGLQSAAQAAPMPSYSYGSPQGVPAQQQPAQTAETPEEKYRREIAAYQQELERRAGSALQIRENASYPELVAAKERAMYGTPEDRAAFERAVMTSDMSDVPIGGIDDLFSGNHITRARQALLQGLTTGANEAQLKGQAADLGMAKFGLQRQAEARKERQGDERNDLASKRFLFDTDRQGFQDWLASKANDRKALESAQRLLKGAIEVGFLPKQKEAEIRGKLAAAENQLAQAGLATTRARAVPYRVRPRDTSVSVGVTDDKKLPMFMKEREAAFAAADKSKRAIQRLSSPNLKWTEFIAEMGVDKAQGLVKSDKDAKRMAKEIVMSQLEALQDRLDSADALRPPGMEGVKMPSPITNGRAVAARLQELGIPITDRIKELLGLTDEAM